MNATTAAHELLDVLGRAEAALAANDMEVASDAMEAASELCTRLQAAGIHVPPGPLTVLRKLFETCGAALTRLGSELDADSMKHENHVRGFASYHTTGSR